jgi:hypothetical protein
VKCFSNGGSQGGITRTINRQYNQIVVRSVSSETIVLTQASDPSDLSDWPLPLLRAGSYIAALVTNGVLSAQRLVKLETAVHIGTTTGNYVPLWKLASGSTATVETADPPSHRPAASFRLCRDNRPR